MKSNRLPMLACLCTTIVLLVGSAFGQGLTGPTSTETEKLETYVFSDDVIIAEPRWVSEGAQIKATHSGISYSATVQWLTSGSKTLEFRDGDFLIASIEVDVAAPCTPRLVSDAGADQVVCDTTSTHLAAKLEDGLAGQWTIVSGEGGTIAALRDPETIFTGLKHTTYILRWTITKRGCGSFTDDVVIAFNDKPARPSGLTGHARFGKGSLTVGIDAALSGLSYHWYGSDGKLLGVGVSHTTADLTSSILNYGTVTAAAAPGCQSDPLPVAITIEPNPVIHSDGSRLVLGRPVQLTTAISYNTYAWRDGQGNLVSAQPVCEVSKPGTYRLTVTREGVTGFGVSEPLHIAGQFDGTNANRVVTYDVQVPGIVDATTVPNATSSVQTITHLDGLGRTQQVSATQASPNRKDLVAATTYDAFGRLHRTYLPAAVQSQDGSKADVGSITVFYANTSDDVADDPAPYRDYAYEPSPLDREIRQYGEGIRWRENQRAQQRGYAANKNGTDVGQEQIPIWRIHEQTRLPYWNVASTGSYYPSGALRVESEVDENGTRTDSYYDFSGRLILRKIGLIENPELNHPEHWVRTVYVYDDLGQLRWVFQPELVKRLLTEVRNPSQTELTSLAFGYRYDTWGRLVMKQEPGRDSVLLVYDPLDRLILMQDGNQRQSSPYRWTFFKYDAFNRPVASGIKDTTALLSRSAMQSVVDHYFRSNPDLNTSEQFVGGTECHGYTNRSYPVVTTSNRLDPDMYLTVTYYDDHRFLGDWPSGFGFQQGQLAGQDNAFSRLTGYVTGEKEKVLDGGYTGGSTWLRRARYYDERYREIQTIEENYKGGVDVITRQLDFSGRLVREKTLHREADVTWKDVVAATPTGNKLIRHAGATSWNSGAASVQQLPAGRDGWVEFTVSNPAQVCAGLSDVNSNVAFTTLDYAICLNTNGTFSIYEQASGKYVVPNAGTYKSGDVFRIHRAAGKIQYMRNGKVVYTSAGLSTSVLMADLSLATSDASIAGCRASFSTTERMLNRRFTYDHVGRPTGTWHQVDSGPEILLSSIRYNEAGQAINRKLHATEFHAGDAMQSVDLRYHIRGWLRSINDSRLNVSADEPADLFGLNLNYESPDATWSAIPRFDGSVAVAQSSQDLGKGPTTQVATRLEYDPLSRIKTGNLWLAKSSGVWVAGKTSERISGYDFNGNLRSVTRNSATGTTTDELVYQYAGDFPNRLSGVRDDAPLAERQVGFQDGNTSSNDFTYDRNGNMLTDLNRGIWIPVVYNFLDQPEVIQRGGNRIQMIYSATGKPLSQVVLNTGAGNAAPAAIRQTDYCGSFIYDQDQLQRLDHSEGRVIFQRSRLLFTENGTQPAQYLPSGATVSTAILNGSERYVTITANSTSSRSGVMVYGSTPVQAGDRVLIRFRGYRTAGSAKSANPVFLVSKLNGTDVLWPGAAVPSGATAEHRIEQMVIIPAGGTLTVGLNWSTAVLPGEMVYINDLEVIHVTPSDPEYQYFLRDHQDNVRVAFTANPKNETRLATFESIVATDERSKFLRFDNARRVTSSLLDRTNGKLSGQAARLNGSSNERYGLAVSLSVMPGDVISAETFAKFIDSNSANWTSALSTLMAQVSGSKTSVVTDGASYSSSTGSFSYGGLLSTSASAGSGPKFYLNWLVFDRDYRFLSEQSGYTRMSGIAREYGQDVEHERLAMPPVTIVQPGFVYIYVSNEESTPVEVYYDDFSVTHRQSPLVQVASYHPFGSLASYYERENLIAQPILFNSKELKTALGLQEYDFGARWFNPAVGRSWQTDPLAARFDRWSPYNWAGNDPVNNIDPDGRDWYRANGSDGKMNPNGEVIWRAGSAALDGYTNIGSRYTFSVVATNGAQVSYTFEQLEFVEKSEMVMAESGWMTQNPDTNPRGCNTCCFSVSKDMVEAEGVHLGQAYNSKSVTMLSEQEGQGANRVFRRKPAYQQGIQMIHAALDSGQPVVVGVDHTAGARNIDGITDHFIVIAGRVTDMRTGAVSFRYFDPGNWRSTQGAATNNILRNQGGLYKSDHYFRGTGKHYTLTHVVQ